MLAAVSMDVNGTLVHTPRMAEIYADILGRHGLRVEPERLRVAFREVWNEFECHRQLGHERYGRGPDDARQWWFEFLTRLCERLELNEPTPFAAAELFDRFAHPEAWEIYPEVPEALNGLRVRGLRLAIVSNWDHRLPILLDRLGLGGYFEVVVYSQEVGAEKPEARIFERLLARLMLPAAAVLHVGDRMREDIEGARAIGMRALYLDRDGGGDIERLTEIMEHLDA
jgi:REG-2-like HAD superfamily hydrolase